MRKAAPTLLFLLAALTAHGQDAFQWSGFASLRGATFDERVASQVQLGLDWVPSPWLLAHVHLLGREDDRSRRGNAGVVEAYIEANFQPADRDRLRLRGGAMFLPTSRENIDALWENAYAISSSALNSWLGEEFRPIGIDATYTHRGAFAGATLYRGNDTFGALPVARGWTLGDHWTLLGEHIPVDAEYFTSVSAETDHRLGWAARAGFNATTFSVQATHIDNRSDGREYGTLFNWGTRFDIVGADVSIGDWTIASEYGWGPTFVVDEQFNERYVSDIDAGYVLVSRGWLKSRATVRVDAFNGGHAVTLAYFHTLRPMLRAGAEVTVTDGEQRALLDLRYRF